MSLAAPSGRLQGQPVARDQQSTMAFVQVSADRKVVRQHFSPIGAPT